MRKEQKISKVTRFTVDNYFALSHFFNMVNFPHQQYKFIMRVREIATMKIAVHCSGACFVRKQKKKDKKYKLDRSHGESLQSVWSISFWFICTHIIFVRYKVFVCYLIWLVESTRIDFIQIVFVIFFSLELLQLLLSHLCLAFWIDLIWRGRVISV